MAKEGIQRLRVLGFQQVTSIAAATALTVPAGAIAFLIQATGAAVRWRADATAPTAAIGQRLGATEAPQFYPFAPHGVQVIQEAPTGVVNVTYFSE